MATAQLMGFSQEKPPCVVAFHRVFKGLYMAAYTSRAGAVLAQVLLKGRVVVADDLLTQPKVCQQIVAGGGGYLLPVKENQSSLSRD